MTRRNRLVIALGMIVAVTVGADTALWAWGCARLAQGVGEAEAALHEQGWTIQASPPVRRGWPFAAELVFARVAVAGDSDLVPGGPVWAADRVSVALSVFHPTAVTVAASGQQSLRVAELDPVPFIAATTRLELTQSDPPTLSIAALQATLATGPVSVGTAQIQFAPNGIAAAAMQVGISQVRGMLDQVSLHCTLTPPIPQGPTPSARARAWRQDGGVFEVAEASLRWGELDASGHAALRLDPSLQPVGDGEVTAAGLAPTLDGLTRSGLVPARTGVAAKAVIALLGAPSPGQPIRLPVQMQNGILSVAGFPLLRFPAVQWDPS